MKNTMQENIIKKNLLKEISDLLNLAEVYKCNSNILKELKELKDIYSDLNTKKYDIKYLCSLENMLYKISNKIRHEWFKLSFKNSNYLYKSPIKDIIKETNNKTPIDFVYERAISYDVLEEKNYTSIDGWNGFLRFYSSASIAFMNIINILNIIFKNNKKNKIGIFWGGYFETNNLINFHNKNGGNILLYPDIQNVIKQKDNVGYIIYEIVNSELDKQNNIYLDDIIQILEQIHKIIFLILDISLQGDYFDIKNLLNRLKKLENVIIITTTSGVKLYQQGFEFSNLGIVSVYANPRHEKVTSFLMNNFDMLRGLSGSSLSFYDICLLDNEIFFDKDINREYVKNILDNNESFYRQLMKINFKFIDRIFYPRYNKSPFMWIAFKCNNTEENYTYILKFILKSMEQLNSPILNTTSFGFRNIHLEIINTKYRIYLRICVGKIKGCQYFNLLNVLNIINNKNIEEISIE